MGAQEAEFEKLIAQEREAVADLYTQLQNKEKELTLTTDKLLQVSQLLKQS